MMPMRRELYPRGWKAISLRIRERDGWRCKFCGAENGKPHPVTGSIVVLTVAHLSDPDPMNCADDNLAALCQRCHLAHDREHHKRNAARTRHARKAAGELF
jgi:5-methylcytosine-specific restriction endonuclease McrA